MDRNLLGRMVRRTCAKHGDIGAVDSPAGINGKIYPGDSAAVRGSFSAVSFASAIICHDLPIIGGPYKARLMYNLTEAFYYEIPYDFCEPSTCSDNSARCQVCGEYLWSRVQGYFFPIRAYLSYTYLRATTTTLMLQKMRKEAISGTV